MKKIRRNKDFLFCPNLSLVGKISKVHGIEGEVIIIFDTLYKEKIKSTEWVFIDIDGLPVPFFVISKRLISDMAAILKLEDVKTPEKAREISGLNIFIETNKNIKPISDYYSIIDFTVYDKEGKLIGYINKLNDYNGNIVIQIITNNGEMLLSLNEKILISIDKRKKILKVDIPEGLLDLYFKK